MQAGVPGANAGAQAQAAGVQQPAPVYPPLPHAQKAPRDWGTLRQIDFIAPMFARSVFDAGIHIHPTRSNEYVNMVAASPENLARLGSLEDYLLLPAYSAVEAVATADGSDQFDVSDRFHERPGVNQSSVGPGGTTQYISAPDFEKLNWVAFRVVSVDKTSPNVTLTVRAVTACPASDTIAGTTFPFPKPELFSYGLEGGFEFSFKYTSRALFLPSSKLTPHLPKIPIVVPKAEPDHRTAREVTNSKLSTDGTHTIITTTSASFHQDLAESLAMRRLLGDSPRCDMFLSHRYGHKLDDVGIRTKLLEASKTNMSEGALAGRNLFRSIEHFPVWTDELLFRKFNRLNFRTHGERPCLSWYAFVNPKIHRSYDRKSIDHLQLASKGFSLYAEFLLGPDYKDLMLPLTDLLEDHTLTRKIAPEVIQLQADIALLECGQIFAAEGAPPNGDSRAEAFSLYPAQTTASSINLFRSTLDNVFDADVLLEARINYKLTLKDVWGDDGPPGTELKSSVKRKAVDFVEDTPSSREPSPARARVRSPTPGPAPLYAGPGKATLCFKHLRHALGGQPNPCQFGEACSNIHQNIKVLTRKELEKKINAFVEPKPNSNLKGPMLVLLAKAPASSFKQN